jgi:hypothetical protein
MRAMSDGALLLALHAYLARSVVPNLLTWAMTLPAVMAEAGDMGKPAARRAFATHVLQVLRRWYVPGAR